MEDKLTVAYEVVEHRLTAIWNAVDAIDTKLQIALGFASTILLVTGGFYFLKLCTCPLESLVLFALALLSYIVLAILGIFSYRVRGWSYRPDPNTLLQYCRDEKYSTTDIKLWVVDECKSACHDNLKMLKQKSMLANWVLRILVVETILLVSGIIYALFAY